MFDWFRRVRAAQIVLALLEKQISSGVGLVPLPEKYSLADIVRMMVLAIYRTRLDWFNGHYGCRPQRVTFAAGALCLGLRAASQPGSFMKPLYDALLWAQISLLAHLERDGHLYQFNRIDEEIIRWATLVCEEISEQGLEPALRRGLRSSESSASYD